MKKSQKLGKKQRRAAKRARRRLALEAPATRPPSVSTGWMLMGALAAGAAMAHPAAASAGAKPRDGETPHAFRIEVDPLFDVDLPGRGVAWLAADGSGAGGGAGGAPPLGEIRFDVAPGTLDAVVAAFAPRAGLAIELSSPDLGELRSPGVVGDYTPLSGLAKLLEGTGATFHILDSGVVQIGIATVREELEVVSRARALSPKHSEPLVDTPQTITVVGADLIQAQGAASLRDVLRNVTGISIQAGEGGGGLPGDNLAIRGFAARNDIFVDGVRDFGAYSRDPYNVEQVEIAKGPASAFSGRGSTGGAINLATKAPTLATEASATVGVGTDDFRRATLDLNRALPAGALGGAALRLNAVYTAGDTPGRDVVENERVGLAPSLALGLEGKTRFWLNGSWLREDNVPDYGIPWVPPTNVPLADHADRPAPVDFDNFYGLVDRDFEETATTLATAIVEHDLASGATIRGLVRHGRSERDSVITAPRFASNTSTDLNRQLQARDLDDRILDGQVNVDLQLETGRIRHAVIAGVEVSREVAENRARSGPAAPVADLFDPDPSAPYPGPIEPTGARTESVADTTAAYLFDTVQIGPRFEVMAGARYDRLDVDFDSRAVSGVVSALGRRDEMLSWRAGVVYKPRVEGSFYAAYGTSFNPAAEGNTGLTLTDATVLLEPEKSRSAELGTKWELFDRRLLATAALFETEKTNARTPGIDPGDPPTVLEGRQRARGVEVGFDGRLSDDWRAFVGYTHLDSEVVESNTPAEVGKELANAPRHSLSFWTTYRFANGLELGGGGQFVDDRWHNPTNVRRAPDYWKLDATAAYEFSERLTLRLHLYNLTDERYVDRVGGGHFVPGAGRSASLTADFKL